jgi:DNA-binding phage protein
MALTRDFKETVAARVQSDPAFAQALRDAAITLFVNGEPESTKLIRRDLVNATVGFEALADEIHKPAKSLHRMLSKSGNPTMSRHEPSCAICPCRPCRAPGWPGQALGRLR